MSGVTRFDAGRVRRDDNGCLVSYGDYVRLEIKNAELLAKAKKFAQAYDEEAPLFDLYLELMQAIASVESKT